MAEPTYVELRQEYAKALVMIDRLHTSNAELLRALKTLALSTEEHNAVAEHVLTTDCRWRFSDALPGAKAAIAKAEGRE